MVNSTKLRVNLLLFFSNAETRFPPTAIEHVVQLLEHAPVTSSWLILKWSRGSAESIS